MLFGICSPRVRFAFVVVPKEGPVAGMSESQRRLVWLWLTLAEFGMPPDFKTLNDRIELQKLVYLAQEATGSQVYHFNPYIRGPYSPSLTRDLYGLLEPGRRDELEEQASAYQLNSSTVENLERAQSIVAPKATLSRVKWLELVASMHYKYAAFEEGFDDTWERVKEWKDGIFDKEDACSAWSCLQSAGLISA